MFCSLRPIGVYMLEKRQMALSKEIVTKTVGNGLDVDVLVDTQGPVANENE